MSAPYAAEERTRHFTGEDARARLLAGIPVTERRMELAGVPTAVLDGGDGPPVLLLHGPAANATHWAGVVPALARTHRVVVPDLPGHGASGTADGALDAPRVLAWLGALIARTCASPPVLVGHALGGAVAMRFAVEQGHRLAGLVLVDTLGLAAFEPAPAFGRALQELLLQPSEAAHERLWQLCAHDLGALRQRMGDRWEAFAAYNLDRLRSPGRQAALGALMGEFGAPAVPPDELARIAVPTTLIWGRHDLATPVAVAEAASARFGWPLRVVEDAADDPPVERPEALVAALHDALARPAAPRRAPSR